MFSIAFPMIDPVLVQVGPFAVRWYALAYIAGIVIGWRLMLHLAGDANARFKRQDADDALVWMTFGVILGGRLGYVLFYKPSHYLANPLDILQVWQGGMSFHGGLLGVILATILFTRRRGIPLFNFSDRLALVAPIGLFFGRLANFVNSELWGRLTDVPWGMVFPNGGPFPRHPSQLYEAALEGVVLLVLLWLLRRTDMAKREGFLSAIFLLGYSAARIISEFFREPDEYLGFLYGGATMGQLLCLPLIALGLWLLVRARREPAR
jgi:phosphatidylglycerol:prolipoprotein diacylglycerol transferase